MILTAKDLRALLRHFDIPDKGSQEDLLKGLKFFLIETDHLFGFGKAKLTPVLSHQPATHERHEETIAAQSAFESDCMRE